MDRKRVNVCQFKRSSRDDWHKGILVNAESEDCIIIDQFGNVYKTVYDLRSLLDEGSFQYEVDSNDISNQIKERRQVIE